jgi:hypothetical protein
MSRISTRWSAVALLVPLITLTAACGDTTDDAKDATDDGPSVSFEKPADGDHIAGGVLVEMAAEGITIEPAGEVHPGSGHFHVIADDGCVDPGSAVPKDADHIHFGKGQTSGTIYLGPGEHELCLQPGDGSHVALEPTDRITVDVGVRSRDEWCAVVKEVDDLFATADTAGAEYAVRQGQYGGIRRLIAQLTDAGDQVDPSARMDVDAALKQASTIAGTFADATDEAAATAALEAVYGAEGA